MKKIAITLTIVGVSLGLAYGMIFAQQGGGYGMMQGHRGGWSCPWMSGTPATGGWYCPWMGGSGGTAGQGQGYGSNGQPMPAPGMRRGQPVTMDQAKVLLERYALGGNPNLKVGDIADHGTYYEAEIVNQSNAVVQKIQVNKQTGWFRPVR